MTAYEDLQNYLATRATLIAQDRSLRRDHREDIRPISRNERKADQIIRALRAHEAKTLWGIADEACEDKASHLFPGMGFLTSESSTVFLNDLERFSAW